MSRRLTLPPVAEPLTLPEVKAHLRLPHDGDDALLQSLIAAARRQAERRTGLALLAQGWSLFIDAWPDDGIVPLAPSPVISVDDVLVRGADDAPATLDPAHYYVDANASPPRLVLRADRIPPRPGRTRAGIEIRLTAGFGTTPAAVPEDLHQALLVMVAQLFAKRGDDGQPAVPPEADDILRHYRGWRLA